MNRPRLVVWAVAAGVVSAVLGIASIAVWPDLDDRGTMLTVCIVYAALFGVAAWFLWNGNFWGAVATIVLNALNVVSTVPFFFDPDPASLGVAAVIAIGLSLVSLVLTVMPEARAFWNRRGKLVAA